MSAPGKCPNCGNQLPERSVFGGCPVCALRGALELSGADAEAVVTEKPGDQIGRYKLLEKIGEGGCGVVYLAEQTEPIRREVALKVIKLGMDTRNVIARFEAERQVLALMDHPNIARVFDAGATDTGRPYFVMELVRGPRLTEYCDENKLTTRERLELFQQVCQAVQHAHQKGIIHRDLKPSNILVATQDNVAEVKVIDFGIAKAMAEVTLNDQTRFTAAHQFLGTPAYMSPEQAGMNGADIDTRSDIYSLGVLLYELLTGHLPFDKDELVKAGFDEMRRIIREEEPPKPSTRLGTLLAAEQTTIDRRQQTELPRLVKLLRGDLDWIVMKSLEKDRVRRYETASDLARDIGRHLNHEPVIAAAPSALYRCGKFARRHRAALTTTTALVVLLIGGVMASTWQATRAKRAETQAAKAKQEVRVLSKQKSSLSFKNCLANGLEKLNDGKYQSALGWLAGALESENSNSEERKKTTLRTSLLLKTLPRPNFIADMGEVPDEFQVDPAGSVLVTRGRSGMSAWDVKQGSQLWTNGSFSLDMESEPPANGLAWLNKEVEWRFSGDGKWVGILSNAPNERIPVLLNANTGKAIKLSGKSNPHPIIPDGMATSLLLNRDGRWLVTKETGGTIGSWSGTLHKSDIEIPQNHTLLWNMQSGECFKVPTDSGGIVSDTIFSPDGKLLAVAGEDQIVILWDTSGAKPFVVGKFSNQKELISKPDQYRLTLVNTLCVDFSPDGKSLLTAGADKNIKVWDIGTGNSSSPLMQAEEPIIYAKFSPDGRRVMAATRAGLVGLWDATSGAALLQATNETNGREYSSEKTAFFKQGSGCLFSPDGSVVFIRDNSGWHGIFHSATDGKTIAKVAADSDLMAGKIIPKNIIAAPLGVLNFSPNGNWLLDRSENMKDRAPRLWDVKTGKAQELSFDDGANLKFVEVLNSGSLLTVDKTGCLATWQILGKVEPGLPLWSGDDFGEGSFNPNGKKFVLTTSHGRVFLCDLESGTNMLVSAISNATCARLDSRGRLIIRSDADKTVQVWDAGSNLPLGPPIKLDEEIFQSFFNEDGTTLVIVTASGKTIKRPSFVREDVFINHFVSSNNINLYFSDATLYRSNDVEIEYVNGQPRPVSLQTISLNLDDSPHFIGETSSSGKPMRKNTSPLSFESNYKNILGGHIYFWGISNSQFAVPPVPTRSKEIFVWSPGSDGLYGPMTNAATYMPAELARFAFPDINAGSNSISTNVFFVRPTDRFKGYGYKASRYSDNISRIKDFGDKVAHCDRFVAVVSGDETGDTFNPETGTESSRGSLHHSDAVQLWETLTGKPSSVIRVENTNKETASRRNVYPPNFPTHAFDPFAKTNRWKDIGHIAFNPDGSLLLALVDDGRVIVIDTMTGHVVSEKPPLDGDFDRACFTQDGGSICAFNSQGKVCLWDKTLKHLIASGHPDISMPEEHRESFVVTNKTVRLIADYDPNRQVTPMIHDNKVLAAKMSPDQKIVATVTEENVLRLFDGGTGQALTRPYKYPSLILKMNFSPDNHGLVITTESGIEAINLTASWQTTEQLILLSKAISGLEASEDQALVEIPASKRENLWKAFLTKARKTP